VKPQDYLEYAYLRDLTSSAFDKIVVKPNSGWIEMVEFRSKFDAAWDATFQSYGTDYPPNGFMDVDGMIDQMIKDGVIEIREVPYVGVYGRTSVTGKDEFIEAILAENPVTELVKEFGESILAKALKNLADIENWGIGETEDDKAINKLTFAPGSDRLVSLNDNQIKNLLSSTEAVIEQVAKENGIDGDSKLRARIVGQLKAGKELILSGIFRLELLRLSLIDSLIILAKKYKKEAIGAVASVLLAELVKVLG